MENNKSESRAIKQHIDFSLFSLGLYSGSVAPQAEVETETVCVLVRSSPIHAAGPGINGNCADCSRLADVLEKSLRCKTSHCDPRLFPQGVARVRACLCAHCNRVFIFSF